MNTVENSLGYFSLKKNTYQLQTTVTLSCKKNLLNCCRDGRKKLIVTWSASEFRIQK